MIEVSNTILYGRDGVPLRDYVAEARAHGLDLVPAVAEEFLQRYPRSDRAQHIEMLTGVHPHPPED